ncbi:hypothetical protein [Paenibacillus agricola]|nr:hypothetical protein [Paenibacillus agricola]
MNFVLPVVTGAITMTIAAFVFDASGAEIYITGLVGMLLGKEDAN